MILIAEYEEEFKRQLIDLVQNGLQLEARAVMSARDLIDQLRKYDFDLLLLDANLPDYRGTNLVKKIRERYSFLQLPIVSIIRTSAEIRHRDEVLNALHSGTSDCLFLPFDEEMALARIANLAKLKQEYRIVAGWQEGSNQIPEVDDSFDLTEPDANTDQAVFGRSPVHPAGATTDSPVPCELPAHLMIGPTTYYTKTKWIAGGQVLLLAFENVPSVSLSRLRIEMEGQSMELEVRESHREDVEEPDGGMFKINFRVLNAPTSYDQLVNQLRNLLHEQGHDAVNKALLQPPEPEPGETRDEAGMTLHFGSTTMTFNIIEGTRYKYEKHIGEGAFASVYLVHDRALKRSVAMKVLNRRMSRSKEARGNFLYEAQTAAQFHHPNIAFVYEVGEIREEQFHKHLDFPIEVYEKHPERIIYLTMQYIEGETLTQWIQNMENRSEDRCIDVLMEIAKAMTFAHEKGVIHRDIKPDNIMITPANHVIVTDFGIANRIENPKDTGGKNVITCTPRYASPEQLFGEDMDGRSDIYSYGTVAYEMLTGKTPFPGRSIEEVIAAKYRRVYDPLDKEREDVSGELCRIVDKCLAFEVNDRYRSADELLDDLQELKGQHTTGSHSLEHSLTELIDQTIMVDDEKAAGIMLARLVAFLSAHKTKEDVDSIQEVKRKLSEPSLLQVLIQRNLTNQNQQMLYEYFIELQSSRAVIEILNMFKKERETWKRSILAELAVVSAGRDLEPLAVFGLELADRDAAVLLRAFGEVASQTKDHVFLVWAGHRGQETQRQLLRIIQTVSRPRDEIDRILEYFVFRDGTLFPKIKTMAEGLMREMGNL
ncbi:Non-specific serine/threonine protein kinase [Sulfidibacter corallicola]|uniref:Protein kinase n=1 Tax=Sulfidibacter corallicola TaxID=2818388 RepID=A0A8A4TLW3_SULCO|nr:protein kinase [Sulfidibacter corallicola]QTD50946.1 protein kinase [Sulfidibacter corallicola]